jgi:hypothetical protein
MLATRRVDREWLDELAAEDPRAIRARRDLARVNAWMLQPRIMARTLLKHCPPAAPRTILDVGAGDGTFMLRVAALLARRWPSVTIILLDRKDIVSRATHEGFEALRWHAQTVTADLFKALEERRLPVVDIITTNLFLHHFSRHALEELLARAASLTRLFVACEPRRAALALLASRFLWAIGCHDVTRHDAVASVQAGFKRAELSTIWPAQDIWVLHEHLEWPFTHCFVASRPTQGSPM